MDRRARNEAVTANDALTTERTAMSSIARNVVVVIAPKTTATIGGGAVGGGLGDGGGGGGGGVRWWKVEVEERGRGE